MRLFSRFVLAVFVCAVSLNAMANCVTGHPVFTTAFRGSPNDDFNDYGRIHVDADNPDCAENAMYALTHKVRNQLDAGSTTFQQWLDGYLVGHVFAAAMRLGAHGWANVDLDVQLERLEGRFAHYTGPPPSGACGGDEFNTCMEDFVGSAVGHAWIAAYKSRRPHRNSSADVAAARNQAISYLHQALGRVTGSGDSSHGICLRVAPFTSGSASPLCNATVAQLNSGVAQTLSVNGGHQKPPYGFGLMAGVASAIIGIEASGGTFSFTSDEAAMATGLFAEMQRTVDTSGNFKSDCLQKVSGTLVNNAPCGGPGGDPYRPHMYGLKPFYDWYLGGIPNAGTYTSNSFDASLFRLGSTSNDFFSYGRYVAHGTHGHDWVQNRPEMMPYDDADPVGYFEGISETGLAQGWTCDTDKPDGRIWVDFYVNGWSFAAQGFAEWDSVQSEINQICGGGDAHRFWVQLPGWTQGLEVRAYAQDYTWNGDLELPCLQSPTCSW